MKRLICLLVVFVLITSSFSLTSFATESKTENEDETILSEKVLELEDLCLEMFYAFGIGYDYMHPLVPGSNLPNYPDVVDSENASQICIEALEMVYTYRHIRGFDYDGQINIVTVSEMCDKVYDELHAIVIARSGLQELVEICEQETNDNNYYDEQLWVDFQSKVADAKELLADESIVDQRVNSAFYKLMYQYNLLCSYNKIYCDIDGDGVMTVMDATYIQRYLVGFETFNSSQVYIVGESCIDEISVINATDIQRFCANYVYSDGHTPSGRVATLLENIEKSNPESASFRYDSIQHNILYYGEVMRENIYIPNFPEYS